MQEIEQVATDRNESVLPTGIAPHRALRLTPPEDFVARFVGSMPSGYVERTRAEDRVRDASAVYARGDRLVHVEALRVRPDGATELAIVTDDRPGLLSLVSSAVCASSFEVVDARVYCRDRSGAPTEAVDFVSVRGSGVAGRQITEQDIEIIESFLGSVLSGQQDLRSAIRRSAPKPRLKPPAGAAVRFLEDRAGADVLLVEADNRNGLLLTITSTLFEQRVRILGSDVTTVGIRAHDRFHVSELDGTPLNEARREQVAFLVLLALERLPLRGV